MVDVPSLKWVNPKLIRIDVVKYFIFIINFNTYPNKME